MEDITKASEAISIEGRENIMTLAERLIQEGIQKGMKKGRQEGREKGREEGQRETAKKLLKMGLSLSQVAEATDLSMKKVEQINRELTI